MLKEQDSKGLRRVQVVSLGKQFELEAANLLNQSFCKENPIWNHYVKDLSQTLPYVREVVTQSIKHNLLYAVIDKQTKEILCTMTFLDMVDYIEFLKSIKGKYDHVKIFSQISSYGSQLQKQIRSQKYQKGKAMYCLLGATKPELFSSKYGVLILSVAFCDFFMRGYKVFYGRCSNQVSKNGLVRFGSKIVKELQIEENKLKFYLTQLDLIQRAKFPQSQLFKYWQMTGFRSKL